MMKFLKEIILLAIVLSGIMFVYLLIKTPSYSAKVCSQLKILFWKTSLSEKMKHSEARCLEKDEKQEGIGSYFVPQNFEHLRCPEKQVGFAKSAMPQVRCFISLAVIRYTFRESDSVIFVVFSHINWGQLIKIRICSSQSKFIRLRISSSRLANRKSRKLSPFENMAEKMEVYPYTLR